MLKNTLSTWNKNRLRFILILFFLALAIPTAILIKQAYSQLKWESFHHYRLQAEELSTRIDQKYRELIETESARTFTDYSFLNIAANTQQKFLQRSPLSAFPVNEKFPGIIGYFQIDNFGEFSTPLLPTVALSKFSQEQDYSIPREEKAKRENAHNQIFQILSQNKLINKPVIQITEKEAASAATEDKSEIYQFEAGKSAASSEVMTDQIMAPEPSPASISAPVISTPGISKKETAPITPQAAFDQLQTQKSYSPSASSNLYSKSKGRVEDLKLEKQYQERSLAQKKENDISKLKSKKQVVSRRKESNVLPELTTALSASNDQPVKKDSSLRINMFESEIDAFEFSLLESGHFVLYRKVWRNGARYIQGLLINPDYFIKKIIAKSFYETNVSNASNLTIAYQGNILSTLNRRTSRDSYSSSLNALDSNVLQGTLLLQNRLSATLDQIELIFSVNNLPAGPGGSVITWLSIILLLILCGGFFSLYILGIKQIVLARQQQDFVSAVSHELKTPLTSIRMYGEMLREGWAPEEKRKQYYDYIYDESERLSRLINNVLQLARMTRNELQVDLKSYRVAELLDNTHSKISSQIELAAFSLNMSCDDTIKEKHILADADYFLQVIINLVDNAIKFSAKADRHQIDIFCKTLRNNKVQFTIRDYGPGINKDQLRKIFRLFYRSENELTRETVGTGIGLSLVKQLVNAMHGQIDVINKEPGIEFQITFNTL
ncbi:MAG: HAMP domain-containing histidine kinase [Gammaproteobacteria bacterium]|nr:HAMP domain-containing histidine kinase [Gammaproteobacteria bacterium]